MKTYLSVLMLTLFPVFIIAQNNPLDNLISMYKGTPGVFFLEMKTNMVFDSVKNSSNIVDLKMFVAEDKISGRTPVELLEEFYSMIDKDSYIGLIEVKSSDENIEVMVKKENKNVSEFVITLIEKNEITMISASGNFDLRDLAKMEELKNCKGLDVIEKICED